jgi:hypothetical protein
MAWTKMKTAIVVGVGVLLAAGTTAVVVEETSQPFDPWANIGSYSKELRELVHKHYVEKAKPVALNNKEANKAHTEMGKRHEDEINSLFQRFSDKAPAGVIIRPTQFSEGQTGNFGDGKHVLASKRMPFSMLFLAAEEIGPHHNMISPARMILPEGVPSGNYDVLVNAPGHNFEQVQAQIKRQFGLTWQVETRVTNVLALTVQNPAAPGLQPNAEVSLAGDRSWNAKMLADSLEERFHWRIVDTTKLEDSQSYSFVVPDKPADLDAVKKTLHDVYGLELVPTNMPIEMLVVEKAK